VRTGAGAPPRSGALRRGTGDTSPRPGPGPGPARRTQPGTTTPPTSPQTTPDAGAGHQHEQTGRAGGGEATRRRKGGPAQRDDPVGTAPPRPGPVRRRGPERRAATGSTLPDDSTGGNAGARYRQPSVSRTVGASSSATRRATASVPYRSINVSNSGT